MILKDRKGSLRIEKDPILFLIQCILHLFEGYIECKVMLYSKGYKGQLQGISLKCVYLQTVNHSHHMFL